jgi:integrase
LPSGARSRDGWRLEVPRVSPQDSLELLDLHRRVPARVVADMLGHSNVSMTLSVYSHVLPELRRDAADRMDAILDG